MASDDLQVMDEMLTTVEQQIKTSLRQIGQTQQGFNPKFKEIFFQAINARAAAAYSSVEMEFQLKVLQLCRTGMANCEAGSSQMNIGAAGQARGHTSCLRSQSSIGIETILQIMDSSDDEDVKPVVIKTETITPADPTDRKENNEKEPSVEQPEGTARNQMNASGEESSTTNSSVRSEETSVINSSINRSAQSEQEIPQQNHSTPSQIGLHIKSATVVAGSPASAKGSYGNPKERTEASTSVGNVKANAARNKLKRHKCEFCGYNTTKKSHLDDHIRTHTGERPYQCERCLKKFSHSSGLKYHQLVHAKGHKFRCVGCVRGFKDEKEKLAHDRECKKRRYECHLCKKYATMLKFGLLRHMRKHSGVKPFQCLICMKRFVEKGSLKTHLDTMHGTKH